VSIGEENEEEPMNRWRIGDVTITRIIEIEAPWDGTFVLPDATLENVKRVGWLQPHFATADGKVHMSIHALVVESKGRKLIVDTCVGNDKDRKMVPAWHMMNGPFLRDLAAAGQPRESIDRVLCTHLHVDHVGWNTMRVNGKWVPTFPTARYLIGRKEWEHWSVAQDADFRGPVEDSVRPIIDAGLADFVEPDHRITEEVWLESTPGHTPGHVSVRISSRGEDAVITGDLMHHPVQCTNPHWASRFDSDPDQARKTRREFLGRYSDRPVLVFGTHFATPSAGRIVRDGDTWRFAV
jgi:glyoxylase-like metal-dependent hydrolase (beta-lactamase superfamily II)